MTSRETMHNREYPEHHSYLGCNITYRIVDSCPQCWCLCRVQTLTSATDHIYPHWGALSSDGVTNAS